MTSRRREEFTLERLMNFQPDLTGADRTVTGRFLTHPLPSNLADRLLIRGETIPPQFMADPYERESLG